MTLNMTYGDMLMVYLADQLFYVSRKVCMLPSNDHQLLLLEMENRTNRKHKISLSQVRFNITNKRKRKTKISVDFWLTTVLATSILLCVLLSVFPLEYTLKFIMWETNTMKYWVFCIYFFFHFRWLFKKQTTSWSLRTMHDCLS